MKRTSLAASLHASCTRFDSKLENTQVVMNSFSTNDERYHVRLDTYLTADMVNLAEALSDKKSKRRIALEAFYCKSDRQTILSL